MLIFWRKTVKIVAAFVEKKI